MTIVLVINVEIILILRVYCLCGKSRAVLGSLLLLLAVQIALQAWAISSGIPVDFRALGFEGGCILTSAKSNFALMWGMPALTDTVIFSLTLYKVWKYVLARRGAVYDPHRRQLSLLEVMFRDGIFYFCAIFSANMLNILIYLNAPADLKVSGATFNQVIGSTLICRMSLNLRTSIRSTSDASTQFAAKPLGRSDANAHGPVNAIRSFLTGDNLVEDLDDDIFHPVSQEAEDYGIELVGFRVK